MGDNNQSGDSAPAVSMGGLARAFFALLTAAPCFYLSWALFNTWAKPMDWYEGTWVRFGVGLMLLEFLLVHSGAFMAAAIAISAPAKRALALAGLLAFYGLMISAFAFSLKSPELVWIFLCIVVGRCALAFTRDPRGMKMLIARSGIGAFFYLICVFGSVLLPIPEWGVTHSVIAQVYPDHGSGVWEQEPYRAIAAGAVYFLIMGVVECFLARKPRDDGKFGLMDGLSESLDMKLRKSGRVD